MAVYKDENELMSTDWQSKINAAVAAGDMSAAADYEQARNDKINAKNYTGAQKTTNNYAQHLGSTNTSSTSTTTPQNQYAGTNYHQDAINAAAAGNWDAVTQYLNQREEKVMAQGDNRGRTSADIYAELWELYGDKDDETGSFSYSAAPTYYDSYSTRIDEMLNQILNRDDFSYNAEDDPMYQQYREQYQREGDRAMKNTLGEASARTGGLASSYATTAAQQANQYYAQQLADKIPELYQLAYQMYLDDIDLQVQDLGLLQGASDTAYSRYRDTMSDWRNDRDFAYGVYRDDIGDDQWQTQFDYNAGRDEIADQRYDTEWEYGVSRDQIEDERYEREWAYQVAQDAAKSSSGNGDSGGTKYGADVTAVAGFLGLSEKEAYSLKEIGAKQWYEALEEMGVSGGGGGDDLPLDEDSVKALGYGPISPERLSELIDLGYVQVYEDGNVLKARKTGLTERSAGNPYDIIKNMAQY